jgi:hypothetical protein
MEFDPLPVMFVCVHVACKIEEVHEITLDNVLAAADFGTDESLRAKVAGLELPLLEGLGFVLLVEPKPCTALRMLVEELRGLLAQGPARCPRAPLLDEAAVWSTAVERAEGLALELALRTDAILHWPTSVVIAAALGAVLDEQFGRPASECGDSQSLSDMLASLLDANLEAEPQRAAIKGMVEAVRCLIQRLPCMGEVTEDSVRETVKAARRCHRTFDRLRQEATDRHEANRKERKRRWSEMKGMEKRLVPTPISQKLSDLNRRAAALRAEGPLGAGLECADEDRFVLHPVREDMRDD